MSGKIIKFSLFIGILLLAIMTLLRFDLHIFNINLNVSEQSNTDDIEEQDSLTLDDELLSDTTNSEIQNIIFEEDSFSEWIEFSDEKSGVRFLHPSSWTTLVKKNSECLFPSNQNICIDIIAPNTDIYINILITKDDNGEITNSSIGFLSERDIRDSKFISLSNELTAIRAWWVNAPSYGNQHNLAIDFIDDIAINSLNTSSKFMRWLPAEESAIYVSYIFNQFDKPTPEELQLSDTVNTMDQILSTLEIDFEVNPFE